MGRGRQKAKHTKVARQLKYFSPETDYRKLEQELTGNARLEEDLERWSEYLDNGPADETGADDTDTAGDTPERDHTDDSDTADTHGADAHDNNAANS